MDIRAGVCGAVCLVLQIYLKNLFGALYPSSKQKVVRIACAGDEVAIKVTLEQSN